MNGASKFEPWPPPPNGKTTQFENALNLVGVDFPAEPDQPRPLAYFLASIVAIVGSLVADAILVFAGTTTFPSTKGYAHFQFSDYAKLTIAGVVIACVGWWVVTRISSYPRWMFFRLAILVTLVLWLPDLYILYRRQPGDAVAVLMAMHLAIALVTYNALVRLAPPTRPWRRALPMPERDELPLDIPEMSDAEARTDTRDEARAAERDEANIELLPADVLGEGPKPSAARRSTVYLDPDDPRCSGWLDLG